MRGPALALGLGLALAALLGLAIAPRRAVAQDEKPTAEEQQEIEKLVRRLNGKSPAERGSAAGALGHYGAKAKAAVPHLLARMKSDSGISVRCAAAESLGRIDDGSANVVAALVAALEKPLDRDQDGALRAAAALALGEIGPKASKAIPALREAATAESPSLRAPAIRALGRIGAADNEKLRADVVKTLRPKLADADRDVRLATALALTRLDAGDAEVVPPLGEAIGDARRNADVRREAAEAIERLGPVAKDACASLRVAVLEVYEPPPGLPYSDEVREEHRALRRAAARALGALGGAAKDAIPALETAAEDTDTGLRQAAKDALDRIRAGS